MATSGGVAACFCQGKFLPFPGLSFHGPLCLCNCTVHEIQGDCRFRTMSADRWLFRVSARILQNTSLLSLYHRPWKEMRQAGSSSLEQNDYHACVQSLTGICPEEWRQTQNEDRDDKVYPCLVAHWASVGLSQEPALLSNAFEVPVTITFIKTRNQTHVTEWGQRGILERDALLSWFIFLLL